MTSIQLAAAAILLGLAAGCAVQPAEPSDSTSSAATADELTPVRPPNAPTLQGSALVGDVGAVSITGSKYYPNQYVYVLYQWGTGYSTVGYSMDVRATSTGTLSGVISNLPCNTPISIYAQSDAGGDVSNTVIVRTECIQ